MSGQVVIIVGKHCSFFVEGLGIKYIKTKALRFGCFCNVVGIMTDDLHG